MQVALRMPADELPILGKGDVAFENAGAHPRRGDVGFARMLGELHRRPAMADREIRPEERSGFALLESILQGAIVHVFDEEKGARSKLDTHVVVLGKRRLDEAR